jgi:diguanylate cyclase (GGDEF)-like protein
LSPRSSARPPARFHSLHGAPLERFLQRFHSNATLPKEVDLAVQLEQILDRARALVPSQSGSILLDDPLEKVEDRALNDLWFVTAFGPVAQALPGTRIPAGQGIASRVYRSGTPHLSTDVTADSAFDPSVDRATGHRSHSIVAAPVLLGSTVCGVVELVDKEGGTAFDARDLSLLEIVAGYTSSTLANALDARRAAELARRDDLTGLYNDRWLHQRVVEMIEESDAGGDPCALVFFDLDHLKAVNDTHGHLAGSQVLREIGFLLRRLLPQPSAVLARYGGDEFVVGLPGTGLQAGVEAAERIRAAIESTVFLDRPHGIALPALNLEGVISASLGIAAYRPGATAQPAHARAQELLRRADQAMYVAKASGKNCVQPAAEG